MRSISANLEAEITRVSRLAKKMGIKFSIVSGMMVLQGRGALVIQPLPLNYEEWQRVGDWQLYECLYARSYRRNNMDYGERKESASKSSTREEIYAAWEENS